MMFNDVPLRTRRALYHRLCTGIVPFWFSMEHLWLPSTPFWLQTDEFWRNGVGRGYLVDNHRVFVTIIGSMWLLRGHVLSERVRHIRWPLVRCHGILVHANRCACALVTPTELREPKPRQRARGHHEWHQTSTAHYTLLKSDVTRRDHVSVVMDAGSRIVNFIVNFIRDGTVFA